MMHPEIERPWWVPALRRTHPGYFTVIWAIAVAHVFLAFDSILHAGAERSAPSFKIIREVLQGHLFVLAVVHMASAVLIGVGLYVNFRWVRWGCIVSSVAFNAIGASFFIAALQIPTVSFYGVTLTVALSLVSARAAREPEFNPLSMQQEKKAP